MSHGLSGQVRLEPGTHTAIVSMGTGDLAPDGPQLGLLTARSSGNGCPLLSPVYIYALLASIEDGVFTALCSFNLKFLCFGL